MRKLTTFLTLAMLFITNAFAQTDVTTTYLVNPGFESATSVSTTIDGWTNVGSMQTQNNSSFSLKEGTWYVEKWQSSGNLTNLKVSQSISGIPNGYYELKAAAFTNQNYGGAYIFANNDSTEVFETNDYSVIVDITDNTLNLGFAVIKSSNWVAADNFRLISLGSTPYMKVSTINLSFDVVNVTKIFKVKAVNLTNNLLLTPPAGITLDKTSLTPAEAAAGVKITATFDKATNITNGTILIASGDLTQNITINASAADAVCFTPLYTDRANIIQDPLMTSLSTYAGWGSRDVVTDYVYCGTNSIKISGKCGGSLDYGLTGKLKPNTNYRVKAMVSTNGTGEAKIGISGATSSNITEPFSTAAGEWIALDFAFTTKASLGDINMYLNSCETQTATECYIDNWEMYELFDAPTLAVDPTSLVFDALNPVRTFTVKGTNLVNDIILTPPTGIALDITTISPAEAYAGVQVTAEYDNSVPITDGIIDITSGSTSTSITVNAFNGVEGCYVPLYPEGTYTNLISDPLMNSLSSYGGWGNKSIVTDANAYCNNSGFINGTEVCYPNSGSIDASIKWKPNTNYRIYAMVRTDIGTMNIGVSNVGLNGDLNFEVPLTNGTWQEFDQTFTTGAGAGDGLCFFNGCGNSTGYIGYIDNWQIYEIPTLRAEGNNTPKDSVLFTSSNQQVAVPITATLFTGGFNVTSSDPTNFLTDVSTLPNTGGTVTVTFKGTASAEANLVISSTNPASPAPGMQRVAIGGTSVTIPMKAVISDTRVNQLLANNLKTYIQGNNIVSEFNIDETALVNMAVYTVNGVKLAEKSEKLNAGEHKLIINKDLNKGVYLIKINIDRKSSTQKIIK